MLILLDYLEWCVGFSFHSLSLYDVRLADGHQQFEGKMGHSLTQQACLFSISLRDDFFESLVLPSDVRLQSDTSKCLGTEEVSLRPGRDLLECVRRGYFSRRLVFGDIMYSLKATSASDLGILSSDCNN